MVLVALVAAGIIGGFGIGLLTGEDSECGDLGSVVNLREGEVAEVSCIPAFVVRLGGDIEVYLAYSPHLGEKLLWDQKRRVFYGQHGETFTAEGTVLSGPGDRPMWRCPTVGSGDDLRIKAKSRVTVKDLRSACKAGS